MRESPKVNNNNARTGCLYGVGVGPGDPELLTIKAFNILSRVPVIFVPRTSDESEGFASSIIIDQIKGAAHKVVGLVLPMTRDKKLLAKHWEEAADRIWERLFRGEDAAFINIGDPLLYGTFIYIQRTLQSRYPGIKVEVIPGISSVNSAAAAALFPLATGSERVAIVAGERDEEFIRETLQNFDTIIFLKVNMIFSKLSPILEELHLSDKCVYVRKSSGVDQEIVRDIRSLKGTKLDYFSVLLVRRETR
jgi:precorrin-2/cobalt-factor-2 C20-methyltransferase